MGMGVLVSTSQFSSSWGSCDAIGMNKEERKKLFFIVNYENFKANAAKGSGEYLEAFLEFESCSNEAAIFIKNNYRRYFNRDTESSFKSLDQELRPFCMTN